MSALHIPAPAVPSIDTESSKLSPVLRCERYPGQHEVLLSSGHEWFLWEVDQPTPGVGPVEQGASDSQSDMAEEVP